MTRPLLSRRGARFTCHGDGLCCTDIHQIGPVTAREKVTLEASERGSVVRLAGLRLLRLSDEHRQGACLFLDSEMRCRIYGSEPATRSGHADRPRSCHRFPYLLAATPDGLRVGTDHRCPCRTLGAREPLDVEAARGALTDARGRLSTDRRIEGRIPLSARSRVGFRRYVALESRLLDELASASAARSVESVLGVEPFPSLDVGSWEQLGVDLAQEPRSSRWGEAFRLFGRTLAWMHVPADERPRRLLFSRRLWAEHFDHAERRSSFDESSAADVTESMLADFVADFVWSLEWTFWCDFTQLRLELASRLAVARTFARALVLAGARADRATAEAIAMIEVVGVSPAWTQLAGRMPS